MSAFSNYLESGLLQHIFRAGTFSKPSHIAIALTSGVPADSETGLTLQEIPSGVGGSSTGYSRVYMGPPATSGNSMWTHSAANIAAGSGYISNTSQIVFSNALTDWGWVSGIVICDTATHKSGNVLFRGQLTNPRIIYTGDSMKFDAGELKITLS